MFVSQPASNTGEIQEKIARLPVQSREQQGGLLLAVLPVGVLVFFVFLVFLSVGHLKVVNQNEQLSSQLCFLPSPI